MSLRFAHPELLLALALVPLAVWLGRRGQRLAPRRRRWSNLLRAIVLTAVVLGLAQPTIVLPVHEKSTAFLLDVSDSVPAAERERALAFTEQALAGMQPDDKAAVVPFGQRALLDRPADNGPLAPIRSRPEPGRTDLAAALRLGLAALPADTGRRLVVLSDGRANQGRLERQIELAKAQNVPVDIVPLAADTAVNEVLIAQLEAPTDARVGQRYEVAAVVTARQAGPARVQISDESAVLYDETVDLAVGENRLSVPVTADTPGFRRYRAVVTPDQDGRPENNQASAYTLVAGPPKVLVVASEPDRAGPLMSALAGAGRNPVLVTPGAMPVTLLGLAEYDSTVLLDVAARDVSDDTEAALEAYVRDLGKGLVMVGGEDSFGAGRWKDSPVEKALPVEMTVRDKEKRPEIAIAFVVDKSGSMADGPSAADRKVDLAKEAVLQAADVLRPEDEIALVAFDDQSYPLWPLSAHDRPAEFAATVGGIDADGGTNIYAGWSAALDELAKSNATVRHIILLTDGQSDASGYGSLLARMAAEGMTLSTVAVGMDAAEYLKDLATDGGGRHYPVSRAQDVPAVFVEETQTAMGTYIVEERFQPVPGAPSRILTGLDAASLPALNGYNGTTAKQTAEVVLWSHQEDPVLAQWQYGLGRSVAWASDLKRQWATDWVAWSSFVPFVNQLVDWTLPAPDTAGLSTEVRLDGGTATVTLRAADSGGSALNFLNLEGNFTSDAGKPVPIAMRQTAPGEYRGVAELPGEGTYMLSLVARHDGQLVGRRTAGVVVPYSPDYADPAAAPTDPRLALLASSTGGQLLTEPAQAFAAVAGVTRGSDIWPWLLLLAALLFPLDVAARRLKLSRGDLAAARLALGARFRRSARPASPAAAPALGGLHAARDRARGRSARQAGGIERSSTQPAIPVAATPKRSTTSPAVAPSPVEPEALAGVPPAPPPPPGPSPDGGTTEAGDTMSRLRDAKRRARRG
jgi:Mg-chelatase subunit ChlD